MKKLELSHLAPYLPYGLKGFEENEAPYPNFKERLFGIISDEQIRVSLPRFPFSKNKSISLFKPILRSLSEIEQDPELFKNLNEPHQYPDFGHFERSVLSGHASYSLIQELISEHYDVFGLIPAGLAIDINTLKL